MKFSDIFKTKPTKKEIELENKVLELQRQVAYAQALTKDGYIVDNKPVVEEIPEGEYLYKNVFETEKGWHFEIIQGNSACVQQDYKPDVEGFEAMTEQEAHEYADKILKNLKGGGANGDNQ